MWPYLFKWGWFAVESYGLLVFVGMFLALFVFWKRAKEEYYDEIELIDLGIKSVLGGVLGGRALYVLANIGDFGLNLWWWVAIWEKPGMLWLGILLGAGWTVWKITKEKRWNRYKTLDLAVIGAALFHAWENLGRFFSGAGAGKMTNLPIGMMFPGLFEKRHPVGLYGAVLWFLGFSFLWWAEGRYRRFVWYQKSRGDARPGFLVFSYLVMLGGIGLILEGLSETKWIMYDINVNVVIRAMVLCVGVVGLYLRSGADGKVWLENLKGRLKK